MRGPALVGLLALGACGMGGDEAVPAAGPPTEAVDPAAMRGMLLHLPDGPDGATVGDDSQCGAGLGTEGDSDAFLDLVEETRGAIETCYVQLEAPDVFVNSLVLSFPSEDVARRAMAPDVFAGIMRYYGLDCCNAESVGSLGAATGLGDDAVSATSAGDASAVVGWRFGVLVGAVSVLRFDDVGGAAAEAQRLALVQDERMGSPVAVPGDIDDDRFVGLEQAPFTAWWVGETFSPPGFPPMELYMSYSQDGMVDLDYHGVRIQVFDLAAVPPGAEPDQMLGVADEFFDSPCTTIEPIDGPGRAFLLGRHVPDEWFTPVPTRTGWDELLDDECPIGDPNVWMATVEVGDLYLRVNPTFCYNCLLPPTAELPYRTPEGLRTVVAGLIEFAG